MMMRTHSRYFRAALPTLLLALPCLPGQAQQGNTPMPLFSRPQQFSQQQPVDETDTSKLATLDNRFGFRLFALLLNKGAESSACISPVSIALALQMTYNGAAGTTQSGMAQALGLENWSLEQVNWANRVLLAGFKGAAQAASGSNAGPVHAPTPPQVDIANSLWLRKREEILPEFVQRVQQFYGAQVSDLKGAPQTINTWVAQHTNHKITEIVTPRDVANIEAALINAVYFKGAWQTPFDSHRTTDKPFHPAHGNPQTCKMMETTGKYLYYQDAKLQMASLPYAGNRLDMLLLLPSPKTSLREIAHQATPENWQKWTTSLKTQAGTIELPRFRVEFGTELNEPLKVLGMGAALQPTANFAAMSRHPLFISKVIHKTFVEVNEQGTEAAAASAVLMTRGIAADAPPPFHLLCDRPFLYAIRDRQTGALLFLGIKG